MTYLLPIFIYGFIFSTAFKVVDLIDEHKWLPWKKGFFIKYISVIFVLYSIYGAVSISPLFIYYFVPIFIFWILKNKMEYPSHVLIMFIGALLFGWYIKMTDIIPIIGITFIYFVLEYVVKKFQKNKYVDVILYRSLWRYYIVPFFIGIYFNDMRIFLYVIPGLLSMLLIRKMIKKRVIQVENP